MKPPPPCSSWFRRWGCLLALGCAVTGVAAPPAVGLSLRGVIDNQLGASTPLHVAVRLEAADDGAAITLAPAAGTWVDALAVELATGNGEVVARAEAVGRPEAAQALLGSGRSAGGIWRFSPEVMSRVIPGNYVVQARLAIAAGSGWIGSTESAPVSLRIVPESEADARSGMLARIRDAMLAGLLSDAAALADTELAKARDDVDLLLLRTRISLLAGNVIAARLCLNRVLALQPADVQQLPPGLHELSREVAAAFSALDPTAMRPTPPAWSWPPAAVVAVPLAGSTAIPATAASSPGSPATPPVPPISTAPTKPAMAAAVVPQRQGAAESGIVVPAAELSEEAILKDVAGQWAVGATASSQYSTPGYSAAQAVGTPNIPLGMAGDNSDAWCPAAKNEGTAWLELAFATPVHASEVRVRQNNAPGAMAKVELIEADGTSHVVWEGTDPFVAPAVREIAWFAVRVPKTAYLVTKVRLTLNLAAVPGWKQIDAVQLVGTAE